MTNLCVNEICLAAALAADFPADVSPDNSRGYIPGDVSRLTPPKPTQILLADTKLNEISWPSHVPRKLWRRAGALT